MEIYSIHQQAFVLSNEQTVYQKMESPIPLFATLCFLSPIMR